MGVATTGRVADVVITVMAKGDIYHTTLGKPLHIRQVVLQRQSVLNRKHNRLPALSLVGIEVGRRAGNADVAAVVGYDIFYLVKDTIGIGIGGCGDGLVGDAGKRRRLLQRGRERLTHLGLGQVGGHDHSILSAFGHLVQIDKDAFIALLEVYALREEHRRVAVGIKSDDAAMQLLGNAEVTALCNEPLEKWQSGLFHPFRMPLHAHDHLVLLALHGLNDTVGSQGSSPKELAGIVHRLMMEGIYGQSRLLIKVEKDGILLDIHAVRRLLAVSILRVFDAYTFNL